MIDPAQINNRRTMNGHSPRAAEGITDQELDEFLAKLNRELTPRMRRWAIALEMIENGYWPQDPQFELLDGALDVVLAIRDDAMNGLWLSLKLYSPEERERQLDEMAKSPVLREWLTLYKANNGEGRRDKAQVGRTEGGDLMSTVEIKSPFLRRAYAEAYAKWEEGNRLGLEQHRREVAWPSTAEGDRAEVSPLGGVARPAAEQKDQR